ncbi:hypothetical protein ACJW30_06G143400 [Castanea mollissima]
MTLMILLQMKRSLQLYSRRQHLGWELIPVLIQTLRTYCCEATLGGIHHVLSRSSVKFFQRDGIHLSAEGSKIVVEEILKVIKEADWEPCLH